MANYPAQFTYSPDWATLEVMFRDVLNHDHENSAMSSHNLDELVALLLQRDRQIEDFLRLTKVVTGSAAGTLATGLTPGFPPPVPMSIVAFHVFLIMPSATAASTFDLFHNGSTMLATPLSLASTVHWGRVVLPTPIRVASIADVLQGLVTQPDYLQFKVVSPGAGAADAYFGAEFL